jgi:hypothetical protein
VIWVRSSPSAAPELEVAVAMHGRRKSRSTFDRNGTVEIRLVGPVIGSRTSYLYPPPGPQQGKSEVVMVMVMEPRTELFHPLLSFRVPPANHLIPRSTPSKRSTVQVLYYVLGTSIIYQGCARHESSPRVTDADHIIYVQCCIYNAVISGNK